MENRTDRDLTPVLPRRFRSLFFLLVTGLGLQVSLWAVMCPLWEQPVLALPWESLLVALLLAAAVVVREWSLRAAGLIQMLVLLGSLGSFLCWGDSPDGGGSDVVRMMLLASLALSVLFTVPTLFKAGSAKTGLRRISFGLALSLLVACVLTCLYYLPYWLQSVLGISPQLWSLWGYTVLWLLLWIPTSLGMLRMKPDHQDLSAGSGIPGRCGAVCSAAEDSAAGVQPASLLRAVVMLLIISAATVGSVLMPADAGAAMSMLPMGVALLAVLGAYARPGSGMGCPCGFLVGSIGLAAYGLILLMLILDIWGLQDQSLGATCSNGAYVATGMGLLLLGRLIASYLMRRYDAMFVFRACLIKGLVVAGVAAGIGYWGGACMPSTTVLPCWVLVCSLLFSGIAGPCLCGMTMGKSAAPLASVRLALGFVVALAILVMIVMALPLQGLAAAVAFAAAWFVMLLVSLLPNSRG